MAFPYLALAHALSEFVPFIARLISGPEAEHQAQKIVKTAQAVTGLNESQPLLEALRKNPKLVTELEKAILEIDLQLDQAFLQDREYARLRDVAILQAGYPNYRADIMVLAAAIGLVACLATITLFRDTLPGEAVGIISTIAGIFGSCLKDAYAFEFGSSRGSKIKDRKINSLLESV